MRHAAAYHLIAEALGVPDDGPSSCAMCGDSPFAAGKRTRDVFGPNFTDYECAAAPSAEHVCTGCVRLLGGRPGDDPPPLRTISFVVTPGSSPQFTVSQKTAHLWELLDAPVIDRHVVSWAQSKQKHHWMHAGISTETRLLIGSDSGSIEYVPERDRPMLDAVAALLWSPTGAASLLPRRAIASGDYHPSAVERFGVARWRDLEDVVARWRPSLLLDLVTACAPVTADPRPEEETVIDPADQAAAELLAAIARASDVRSQDGKMFWGGFFRHRVTRFGRLPLATFVSRMLDECQCRPFGGGGELAARIAAMPDEQTAAIERSIRERPALLLALAYEQRKGSTETQVAQPAPAEAPSLFS